jgi:hypothetical protein
MWRSCIAQQTWRIRLSDIGVQAVGEPPKSGITFDRKAFARDTQIAKLRGARVGRVMAQLGAASCDVRRVVI